MIDTPSGAKNFTRLFDGAPVRQSSALDLFQPESNERPCEVLGRPTPLWILGILGVIGGFLCTLVVLQFAEVIPWAGEEATYIGGRWTGVVIYAFAAGFFFAAAYAWLTVKPWASMITILAAIIGFFVPFISHMDGTDPRSSAIAPLIVAVLMLFMVFRPATNRAMARAMSGEGNVKTVKAPPPPKPMSKARKREVAQEQARAAKAAAAKPASGMPTPQQAAATPALATAAPANTVSAPAATKPVPTATQTAAGIVLSAASSLKSAAATPASPRKGVTSMVGKPAPPVKPAAAAPPPAPAAQQRPGGFRADDV